MIGATKGDWANDLVNVKLPSNFDLLAHKNLKRNLRILLDGS